VAISCAFHRIHAVEHRAQIALDHRQRRAQLVRDIGRQVAPVDLGPFQ